MPQPINIFSHRPYWAARFGIAPVLPMSRDEMDELGWDSCDIIIVTGDAYVDHPSFGMALIGRLLEARRITGTDYWRITGTPVNCFDTRLYFYIGLTPTMP